MFYFDSGTDGTILPTHHTSNGLDGVLRTFYRGHNHFNYVKCESSLQSIIPITAK